jgi:alpha-tubulin suppressor-like RCC1 family protein
VVLVAHSQLSAAKRGKEKPVEEVPEPKKCVTIGDCNKVACGGEFTMWLCKGKLYAAGNPQSGQLGDGSDHSLNVKDSSIKIMHEPQGVPALVPHIPDEITNVACGVNHTVCVTSEGECYTWGSGNYGRLGHKVQQVRRTGCMSLQLPAIHLRLVQMRSPPRAFAATAEAKHSLHSANGSLSACAPQIVCAWRAG